MAEDGPFDKKLGIRRRTGRLSRRPDLERPTPSEEQRSSTGSELGIRRRARADPRTGRFAKGAIPGGAPELEPPPRAAPLAPELAAKLGRGETANLLAGYFAERGGLLARLPDRLWTLEKTHGRYQGDGSPERLIKLGWEPALVVFTTPDTELNLQPRLRPTGFVVEARHNRVGSWYAYVVFQSDGQPLDLHAAFSRLERPTTSFGVRRRT